MSLVYFEHFYHFQKVIKDHLTLKKKVISIISVRNFVASIKKNCSGFNYQNL